MNADSPPFFSAPWIFAVLLGIAVPSVAFGPAVFGVIIGLGMVSLLFFTPWHEVARFLWAQCRTPLGVLILLTFVAWMPNVFISEFPLRSLEAVSRTLFFVAVGSAFYSGLSTDQRLVDLSLRAFMASAAISLVFALLSMTVLPELFWAMRLKGWHSDSIGWKLKGFSALSVLIVPVVLLAGYRTTSFLKNASIVISIGYLILAWENYNRSTIAGFLAAMAAVGVAISMRGGSKKKVLSIFGGIATLTVTIVIWLIMTRGEVPDSFGYSGDWLFPVWLIDFQRQVIWETAWNIGLQSPWFGIGVNTINFAPGADLNISGTALNAIPAHPHNWAVEVFAETGAIGLFALGATIIVMVSSVLLGIRRTGNTGMIAAIAILAGYWVSGLFNFSYWAAWWQASFMLSLAICYASGRRLTYN